MKFITLFPTFKIISTLQKSVWGEMAKLDSFAVDVILDELVRAASDGGGVGTRRCEIIRQVVASLSSIHVRSRMYSKLRKVSDTVVQRVLAALLIHSTGSDEDASDEAWT